MNMTTTTIEALEQLNKTLEQRTRQGQKETQELQALQDKMLSDIAALTHTDSAPSITLPWPWLLLGAGIGAGLVALALELS